MKRSSKSPPAYSKFMTFRDVAGPGIGMGPSPDQHLGGVVGTYVPTSIHAWPDVRAGVRSVSSQLAHWVHTIGKQSDPSINNTLELFHGLSKAETEAVSRHFSVVDVNEGRLLGRQGTRCREFTVIVSGQVGISRHGVPIKLMGPGCWFGCLALLGWGDSQDRFVSVTALSDVRVAVANEREFEILVRDFPVVGDRIFRMAHRRLSFVRQTELAIEVFDPVEHHVEYPIHLPETIS